MNYEIELSIENIELIYILLYSSVSTNTYFRNKTYHVLESKFRIHLPVEILRTVQNTLNLEFTSG